MIKLLKLEFIPASASLGQLILRLWVGLSMLLLHGWGKLSNYSTLSEKFMSVMGLSPSISLILAICTEVLASILLVLGLFTRAAAATLAGTMFVAFSMAHGMHLTGEKSGELAFIYLAAYVALIFLPPGRFSLDSRIR